MLALPHPDWLYHHRRVTGDPAGVAAFQAAAAGAGVIPGVHDLGPASENWFHLLAVQLAPQRRSLSLEGCHILASQLRDAAEARQRLVAECGSASGACPLDLHWLLPVPARLLRLGSEATETRASLWEHWDTTPALRPVVPLPTPGRGTQPDPELWWVGFWSADWTPWRVIQQLGARWPTLRLEVRSLYDDP